MAKREARGAPRKEAVAGPQAHSPRAAKAVVAIGASAGGLQPIGQFLAAMPADSGLAFVVLQHLDPTSRSLLPELLQNRTAMPVRTAEQGAALAPNQIYVIPRGSDISVADGTLHLTERTAGGPHMPIDVFFKALAADYGKRGIGVVLSGSGGDGAEGLKVLKEAGGLALVQDPGEAQQDGMPREAMRLAHPDYVLRVQDMIGVVTRYAARDFLKTPRSSSGGAGVDAVDDAVLGAIVALLKSAADRDFGRYKSGTLQRRIQRRMMLHGIVRWADYLAMLRGDPGEVEALANDLLINVTHFFRDAEAFDAVAERIPDLLRAHASDQPARVWVAGCSTGEEAYSLGMLFMEEIAASREDLDLQVFATDIDDEALQVGRAGVYPEGIRTEISPERLERFFTPFDGRYKVIKALRDAVIFSRHDLLSDSPFSRLDLLSCRNVLIYLTPEAQSHVLALAHFALRDGGLLLLGSAESAAVAPGLFEPVNETLRLYRRVSRERSARVRLSTPGRAPAAGPPVLAAAAKPPTLPDIVQRALLDTYAPAGVAVDRQLNPVYFFGPTDRYLRIASGEPGQNLLSMAREGLSPRLHDTISRAFRAKRRVAAHGVRFKRAQLTASVTIEAQRLGGEHDAIVLVTFVDEARAVGAAHSPAGKVEAPSELSDLRLQLTETRRELNRTIHDLRAANEEFKTKNEEAMSLNEEFLSTNEELESSKEELQSLNEELTTVNNQLHQTLEQQQQTSADLENLLDSSPVATIMLDADLRIKIFNPRMKALFALIESDIGRPLADLAPRFADPGLPADAMAARSAGTASEREIRHESGAWYMRSVLPYRGANGDIEGAVVTFADVSGLKQAELDSAAARRYAEAIVEAVHEPLVVLDPDMCILSANVAFRLAFDLPAGAIAGRRLQDLERPALTDRRWLERLAAANTQDGAIEPIEIESDLAQGGRRTWQVRARVFRMSTAGRLLILLTFVDVTDDRRILRQQWQLLIDALPGAFMAVDKGGVIRGVNDQITPLLGYRPVELIGQRVNTLVPVDARDEHPQLHAGFVAAPKRRIMNPGVDIVGVTKDGQSIPLEVSLGPMETAEGLLIIVSLRDLRKQKEDEARLRDMTNEADRANRVKSRFLAAASHDLRQPLQTISLLHGILEKQSNARGAEGTFAKLNAAVVSMAELLDTLLDVNQIESGVIVPEIGEIALAELLGHVANDFLPLAAAKGLSLSVVATSAIVRSDRRLLARMIGNLLSNAIKYTDSGRILLGCRRRAGAISVEVWDTGAGIPVANLQRIFEEFYRVDRTDSGKLGLGLGLSIVQRFGQILGHEVEVHSATGKGTRFAVVIADPVYPPRAWDSDHVEEGADAPPKVLLIEDDAMQLDTLRILLEFEGYAVKTARTGEEALAQIRATPPFKPDFIIADYNLPGDMTGLDLIRGARKLHPNLPAAIISGDRQRAVISAIDNAEVTFIAKPAMAGAVLAAALAMARAGRPEWIGKGRDRFPHAPTPVSAPGATIAVIDDESGVRDALKATLEAEGYGVAAFGSAEDFLSEEDRRRFRCLIVDINLPSMSGLALQRRLKAEGSAAKLIFVTGQGDLSMAVHAIREGAADFLQKPVAGAALIKSVTQALEHGPEAAAILERSPDTLARLATLTERERQVIDLVVKGMMNKNVAAELGISQRTAEHHRQNAMRKMGAPSLARLVRIMGPPPGEG